MKKVMYSVVIALFMGLIGTSCTHQYEEAIQEEIMTPDNTHDDDDEPIEGVEKNTVSKG
ncbi:MAG: hypothetical protein WBA74_01840 [Cyclobacteriaceae bacterium]